MTSIKIGGVTYMAENKEELFKAVKNAKIKISKSYFNKLINSTKPPTNYLINKKTKEIYKLDASKDNKPLLKKKFGILKKDVGNKQKNLRFADLNKDFKISQILPKDSIINVIINVSFKFKISKDTRKKEKSFIYKGINNKSEIENYIQFQIENYLQDLPVENIFNVSYNAVSNYTGATMDFNGMVLREQNIIKIFNENIENVIPPEGENCVKYYLNKTIRGLKKQLKKIDEFTIDDLKNFCIDNEICLRVYDINKNLKASNIIRTKSKKSVNIVAWNNHLYPMKNAFFKKENPRNNLNFVYKENIKQLLIDYLDNGELPVKVSTCGHAEISYFITDDNIVYSNNDEYEKCLEVAKKLGIQDKIDFNTNLSQLGNIILELYKKENINSIWLNSDDFVKGGFNYSAGDEEELSVNLDKIKTIDKNKCYSYLLRNLPYLVKLDVQKNKPIDLKNHIIEDHYMYVVKPKESSILIPNTNVYFGSLLKFAETEGIEFEIIEAIETSKAENCFSEMIDHLFNICPDIAKDIINRMIGTFNIGCKGPENIVYFDKICNGDETDRSEGYKVKLNDDYNILYNIKKSLPKLGTKKPIAFQILDESRIMIYKKMKELGLEDKDIIKVKTDSISFLDKGIKLNLGESLDDWKEEKFKPAKFADIVDGPISTFKRPIYTDEQTTKLILGNAGCGKSYDIMNNLIPSLNKSYLVITPTNSTMSEYKKNGFNVKVKQTFTLSNTIPDEDVLIIDEIGMSDYSDFIMIMRCILAGKDIYGYGDFTQLLPVGEIEQKNDDFIINMLFSQVVKMETNYRNNFTAKYYDDLRYNYNKNDLLEEVIKHSTKWKDAEYIVVYTNETKDKYNKMKMEYLGLNSIKQKGCRVICKTNDLREKNIYNKYRFEVVDCTENEVIIKDDLKSYHINIEAYEKYFHPAYALTLYCIQGESIKSYHFPTEDYKFITGRSAYTLISRLKIAQKITTEKEKN